ncbi:MAG: glycosyltransferase family 9 protein [Gemmataceae bacterium]|nr:glycosyltransferase family 9 protein [Gemmataceae bacterium]MDW8264853.1 glycosyltransferase family 9 protein [Gemmataceae bacterium]
MAVSPEHPIPPLSGPRRAWQHIKAVLKRSPRLVRLVRAARAQKVPLRWLAGALKQRAVDVPHQLRAVARGAYLAGRLWFPVTPLRRRSGRSRVLIALIEHLGDLVACQPVAREVRRQHPAAQIIWVVRPEYQELVCAFPEVDATLAVECLTEWMVVKFLGDYDRAIDLHLRERYCLRCRVPLRKTIGDPRVTMETYFDHGSLLQAMSKGAGIPITDDRSEVAIPATVLARVERLCLPAEYVVVHGISNLASKDWDAAKWRVLVERILEETAWSVVEVGLRTVLPGFAHPRFVGLCGQQTILEMAAVVRRARLFIGIDSGPAHLANAFDVPGVVLLGRYNQFQRPLPYSGGYARGNAELVRALPGELPVTIPVEWVWQAVRRRWIEAARPSRAA